MPLDRETLQAVAKYGPTVNAMAKARYGISGRALLAKLITGESGGDKSAVSNVGARGRTQFMPGSRDIAVKKYGVDPWKSADEAVHAAALHLQGKINGSKGLEGYNPGMASYTSYILGQKVGDLSKILPGGGTPKRSGGGSRTTVSGSPSTPGVTSSQVDLTALLESQLGRKPQRATSSTPGTSPDFLAKPVTAAAVPVSSGHVVSQGRSSSALDAMLSTVKNAETATTGRTGDGLTVKTTGGSSGGGGAKSSAPKAKGSVSVAPGANRAGADLSKSLKSFVNLVSAQSGRPYTITTGTNHNQMTVDGNVSDHWDGHGADLAVPDDSRKGDILAAHAIAATGIGFKKALQMAKKGGLYNLDYNGHRVQVIWKTNQGGNHHNHVHIGIR